MKQVIIIHGGDTFDSYDDFISYLKQKAVHLERLREEDWKDTLQEKLGKEFDVLAPPMPSKANAKYYEWKIWFEKLAPFFEENVILVGHSLGGIFLAKYLSENAYPKKIRGVFLVAAPYDKGSTYSLADFTLPKSLKKFSEQARKIFIYQSEDDTMVEAINADQYHKDLSQAVVRMFKDQGHFNREEIPGLVKDIKSLS